MALTFRKTCMDCKDRHPKCHSTCELYNAAKEEYTKLKSEYLKVEKARSAALEYYTYTKTKRLGRVKRGAI